MMRGSNALLKSSVSEMLTLPKHAKNLNWTKLFGLIRIKTTEIVGNHWLWLKHELIEFVMKNDWIYEKNIWKNYENQIYWFIKYTKILHKVGWAILFTIAWKVFIGFIHTFLLVWSFFSHSLRYFHFLSLLFFASHSLFLFFLYFILSFSHSLSLFLMLFSY